MKIFNFLKKSKKEPRAQDVMRETDLSKYKVHEYVVFYSSGVYDHGEKLPKIIDNFRKDHPEETPLVVKVPPKKFALHRTTVLGQ